MDLKRLRYAIGLADELNFARAAEKLHLSQPALSRSIQTLEEELGMLLFDRDNRNVAVTTAGAVFLDRARQLLEVPPHEPLPIMLECDNLSALQGLARSSPPRQ